MPRNGSGVYSFPANTEAVTDETISSTKYNTRMADVEADLNAARPISAGGTGATTADGARANLSLKGWGRYTRQEAGELADANNPGVSDVLNFNASTANMPVAGYGVLFNLSRYDGAETMQVALYADQDLVAYRRRPSTGAGAAWTGWHKQITDTGDQTFKGSIRSDRDIIAQRDDSDAVIRLNKGATNYWSIRRRQSDNALDIANYGPAADLVAFRFDGNPGDQARLVPLGDVSNEANLLTRKAGDDRYAQPVTSSAQVIVSGGQATIAHGLGRLPRGITYRLKCISADAGYGVGDDIFVDFNGTSADAHRYSTPVFNSTNIYVRFSDNVYAFAAGHKTTGAATGLTNSKWQLYVEYF